MTLFYGCLCQLFSIFFFNVFLLTHTLVSDSNKYNVKKESLVSESVKSKVKKELFSDKEKKKKKGMPFVICFVFA